MLKIKEYLSSRDNKLKVLASMAVYGVLSLAVDILMLIYHSITFIGSVI